MHVPPCAVDNKKLHHLQPTRSYERRKGKLLIFWSTSVRVLSIYRATCFKQPVDQIKFPKIDGLKHGGAGSVRIARPSRRAWWHQIGVRTSARLTQLACYLRSVRDSICVLKWFKWTDRRRNLYLLRNVLSNIALYTISFTADGSFCRSYL